MPDMLVTLTLDRTSHLIIMFSVSRAGVDELGRAMEVLAKVDAVDAYPGPIALTNTNSSTIHVLTISIYHQ